MPNLWLAFFIQGGNCQQNSFDLAPFHKFRNILGGAHDLHPHDIPPLFFRRVIHTADNVHIRTGLFILFMKQGGSRITCADQKGSPCLGVGLAQPYIPVHTVGKPGIKGQCGCKQGAQAINRHRYPPLTEYEQRPHHKQGHCHCRRHAQPEKLHDFRIPPQAVVHAEQAIHDLIAADKEKAAGHQQAGIVLILHPPIDEHPGHHIGDRNNNHIEQDQHLLAKTP